MARRLAFRAGRPNDRRGSGSALQRGERHEPDEGLDEVALGADGEGGGVGLLCPVHGFFAFGGSRRFAA